MAHDTFISDIWFSLPVMLIAGVLCGLCIACSYYILTEEPSVRGWLGYNGLYVLLLAGVGIASVAAFDPVTTIAALIAEGGPPDQLFGQALPLTLLFTLIGALTISGLYRRDLAGLAAALTTSIVVVLFLGMSISAIGLVEVQLGSVYLILELFGLILVLVLVFLAVFGWFERRNLLQQDVA